MSCSMGSNLLSSLIAISPCALIALFEAAICCLFYIRDTILKKRTMHCR